MSPPTKARGRGGEPRHSQQTAGQRSAERHRTDAIGTPARDAILDARNATASGTDVYLSCPAHDDRKESLCVRATGERRALVRCHAGCETAEVMASVGLTMGDLYGDRDNGKRPAPLSEHHVSVWSRTLLHDAQRLAWLVEHRGLTRHSIATAEIGWDGERYTIPIHDADGELVNVRRYNRDLDPKIMNSAGHGSPARLYPFDVLHRHDEVVLCESELDALLLNQHGIAAVTGTGGASVFRPEWAAAFKDKTVWTLYDCDDGGTKGEHTAALHLYGVADVRVAHLPFDRDSGEDVTDWFVKYGKSSNDLRLLLAETQAWQPGSGPALTTWGAVDLGAVLRGETVDSPPTMLRRTDGVPLIYPGKVHAFNSESEAGKTWLALHLCAERLTADEHVLFVDFEDSAEGVVGRLLAMGVPADAIQRRFIYIRPDEPLNDEAEAELFFFLRTYTPTVAVLDGVTEAMVLHGFSIKDNDDAARFMKLLTRPLARAGSAVVLLDHVTKDKDGRGRFAIGAQHKLAGVDGAVYRLENKQAFGRGMTGSTLLSVAKDRPGHVRPQAVSGRAGTFVMESYEDGTVSTRVDPASAAGTVEPGTPAAEVPAACVKVSRLLEKAGGEMSSNDVAKAVGGRKTPVLHALRWMAGKGYIACREDGQAKLYRHVRPFEDGDGTDVE